MGDAAESVGIAGRMEAALDESLDRIGADSGARPPGSGRRPEERRLGNGNDLPAAHPVISLLGAIQDHRVSEMLDAVARVGARELSLRRFEGIEGDVLRAVADGVDPDLPAGLVRG